MASWAYQFDSLFKNVSTSLARETKKANLAKNKMSSKNLFIPLTDLEIEKFLK